MLKDLRSIVFIIGILLLPLSIIMTIPAVTNLLFGYEWKGFIISSAITLFFSIVFSLLGKLSKLNSVKDFAVTSCVWFVLPLFAAIPFLFETSISYVDAVFETISGITTTGATILSHLHEKSPGILLWRAILSGIGGLGIITIGIIIFPSLKFAGLRNLLASESSEVAKKKLPNIVHTVAHITIVYCIFIFLCILLYYFAGMSIFDAICHGISTVSTGGFANYDDSLAHYNSIKIEIIAVTFMLLGACPFLTYLKMTKRLYFYDEQILYFIGIIIVSVLITFIWIHFSNICLDNKTDRDFILFRYSIFSIVSLTTSAGFTICDYSNWCFIVVFAFFLTLIGGCSGSTSGGVKIFRIVVLIKAVKAYFHDVVNPNETNVVKLNGKILEDEEIKSIFIYFFLYISIFTIATIAMSFISKVDFITSLSAISAALTNSGPGFGAIIGPSGNYATFSNSTKLLLSLVMLIGRLEILPVFAFLSSVFYKLSKDKTS
ncbi:TrkH family potassium uptake protein [Candidatus Mesenet endosymbiont of Phosphuga atrata]|uniref:TrkH family potassium uptake protein n=1 Tax=Candidatus Mesenet endosymbiont of Phosphuga atrata TaxID=3066221 RepID=UPI0030D16F6D